MRQRRPYSAHSERARKTGRRRRDAACHKQIGTVLGNCDARNELGELRPCLFTCGERAPGLVGVVCGEGVRVALCCSRAFGLLPGEELWSGTREAGYWA